MDYQKLQRVLEIAKVNTPECRNEYDEISLMLDLYKRGAKSGSRIGSPSSNAGVELKEELKKRNDLIIKNQSEIWQLIKKYVPDVNFFYDIDFLYGCDKSPFGWCAYHRYEDQAHDNCIFCHQPQERK